MAKKAHSAGWIGGRLRRSHRGGDIWSGLPNRGLFRRIRSREVRIRSREVREATSRQTGAKVENRAGEVEQES